jgi:hypothetical protein
MILARAGRSLGAMNLVDGQNGAGAGVRTDGRAGVRAVAGGRSTLRLVVDEPVVAGAQARHSAERRAVEAANRRAAGLVASDARWVLATTVAGEIQGGRAAVVTPASRDRILATARRLGLRAFDASLVIAIVQDGARRGETLGEDVEGRLTMIRPAAARGERSPMWLMAASVGLAAVLAAGMIAVMAIG